jgi:Uma2 family endonuclease
MSLKDSQQMMSVEIDDEAELEIDEVDFYWDIHLTEKDQMGESAPHSKLIHELIEVIEWLLHNQKRVVLSNFSIYTSDDTSEDNQPLEPDIAIFKDIELNERERNRLRSWKIGSGRKRRPPPNVVFEFASRKTWRADLESKPQQYAAMRGQEYFAYDPNTPQYYKIKPVRLKGWRLENGQPTEIQPNDEGWLWSNELDSYLVPDGNMLQLYDREGNRRLTQAEAERQRAERERAARQQAEAKKAQLEAENEELRRTIEQLRREQGLQ